jgi:hypothetical protein
MTDILWPEPYYKLVCYVPETHVEVVKNSLFEAGAGRIGDYEQCCWQVLGQGQFKPLAGAKPFIGQAARLEQVSEYKIELLCQGLWMTAILKALLSSHPYEEPAFDCFPVISSMDITNQLNSKI